MKKLILRNNAHWFDLLQEGERFFLTVSCGGIAVYERTIELDADEMARWRSEGESYLIDVAYGVGKNDKKYASRYIPEV